MTEFVVFVDDNFHYMDPTSAGRWASSPAPKRRWSPQGARRCQFERALEPGMSARELYSRYEHFGDDPFIVGGGAERVYSRMDYAKARSEESRRGKQP